MPDAYDYISTGDNDLPVNTREEIAAAAAYLSGKGEDSAPVYRLPAHPDDGGDWADSVETTQRVYAR